MSDALDLDRLLHTDPRDVGCGEALRLLTVYVDLVLGTSADEAALRHPGVAVHLASCGPCGTDFEGLLQAVQLWGNEQPVDQGPAQPG